MPSSIVDCPYNFNLMHANVAVVINLYPDSLQRAVKVYEGWKCCMACNKHSIHKDYIGAVSVSEEKVIENYF